MNLYRPIYHYIPEKNWMNDPNGVVFYKDEYHLFYQYNPYGSEWGTIHWGHAKSKDLVHWERLPVALYPSNEKGELHCFSGCAVINEGEPTIFYTSIGEGERHQTVGAEQWMATSKDDMITWDKYDENPALDLKIHKDLQIKEWRDPFVWKDNDTWFMVVGGSHDDKGCALIYKSMDLRKWEFLNILLEDNECRILECPNCFKLGDKYILVYSPDDIVSYCIGTIDSDFKFIVESKGILDQSGWEGFYAPNSFPDDKGRRIMFGWLTEVPKGELQESKDWAGAQSIPRILTLEDNKLKMEPAKELEILRNEHKEYKDLLITDTWISDINGRAIELLIEIDNVNENTKFSIDVLASELEDEKTSLIFNGSEQSISINRSKSSLSGLCHDSELKSKVSLCEGKLKLHIFIDHSIVELFANYRQAISTRVYPISKDSENIKINILEGNELKINSIDVWNLNSIWQN